MIALLDLLFVAIIFGIVLFLATQIAVPLYRGTALFPMFRSNELLGAVEKAEHQLEDIAVEEHLEELTESIERRKAKLKRKVSK